MVYLPRRKHSVKLKALWFCGVVAFLWCAAFFISPAAAPPKSHQRHLNEVSLLNAIDGDGCGEDSTMKQAGLVIWVFLVIYIFFGLAILCDDFFLVSLELIAQRFEMPEDVAGATLLAAGSSSPELFAALIGVFFHPDDNPGPGGIVGSVVFNICIIIGGSALISGSTVVMNWKAIARDTSFNTLAVIVLYLSQSVISPGLIEWWEAMILVILYVIYILLILHLSRRRRFESITKFSSFISVVSQLSPYEEVVKKEKSFQFSGQKSDLETPITAGDGISGAGHRAHASSQYSERLDYIMTRTPSLSGRLSEAFVGSLTSTGSVSSRAPRGGFSRGFGITQKMKQSSTVDLYGNDESDDIQELQSEFGTDKSDQTSDLSEYTFMVADDSSEPMAFHEEEGGDGKNASKRNPLTRCCAGFFTGLEKSWYLAFKYTIPDCKTEKWRDWYFLSFLLGIVWLGAISFLMVDLASKIGVCLGMSPSLTGLTLLAIGSSLPDALGSMIVARKGKCEMAVCNAFGSNVFDILLGLGLPWMLYSIVYQQSTAVSTHGDSLFISMGIMIALFIILVSASGFVLKKNHGYILILFYVGFIVYIFADSKRVSLFSDID